MKYLATVEGRTFQVEIKDSGELMVNGKKRTPDLRSIDGLDLYSFLIDNTSYEVFAEEEAGHYRILVQGELFDVGVKETVGIQMDRPAVPPAPPSGEVKVLAPIPGVVATLAVAEGDVVQNGQILAVLESMKMENELRAPCEGIVREVKASVEEAVDQGQVVVIMDAKAKA